ncbi:MAG: DEAD/DEAH box helicase [archaeon]
MSPSLLRDLTPRLYQETIFSQASKRNTLVVLPTGMGKTSIALMLAAFRLGQYPKSKILVLAPTKPLVEQIMRVFQNHLTLAEDAVTMMTGLISPEKRQKLFSDSTVIATTPQGLENDVISNRIRLEDVSLMVFDEAHRAVKDYAYVWLAKQYNRRAHYPLILGLTASPGSEMEAITEVCQNLHVEDIEVRTETDPDVAPYIQDVEMKFTYVQLPDNFKAAKQALDRCFRNKVREAQRCGALKGRPPDGVTKRDILGAQAQIHGEIAHGNKDFDILRAISLLAEAMKVQHGLELLETQGITSVVSYLSGIMAQSRTSKVKAVQNLVRDPDFRAALVLTESLQETGVEHPKLDELVRLVTRTLAGDAESKIIVFNQYRDNAKKIVEELGKVKGASPKLFVGQAKKKDTGMTQKEQLKVLEDFRQGLFNIAVMTSVGEEGLDIPSVDLVVFYEPIPSAIRHIQRRGRTGRLEKGQVTVLVTKGTRDEGYRWSAHHKERSMHSVLARIKQAAPTILRRVQPTLADYDGKASGPDDHAPPESKDKPKVIIDPREKGNPVVKELVEQGAEITLEVLDAADYLLSSRVAVEFKTVSDFVDSMLDGRLMEQLKRLKELYERPIIIIEGTEDMYSVRNIHPNALRGLLSTIVVSYGIPLVQTKTTKDTVGLMMVIAKREQEERGKAFHPHASLKPKSMAEMQEYIVSSLPGVGPNLAKPLLRHFGSVAKIVLASADELQAVEKIGKKKAAAIREMLDGEYMP